jgi:Transcriptional Coactivator p15 (PC4)
MPITDVTTTANAPQELAETIAKFRKSARDGSRHVRVDLSEFKGHRLISIRVWETGTDGIDRPSKAGLALAIRKLPELTCALLKAEERAREMGLLPDDGAST